MKRQPKGNTESIMKSEMGPTVYHSYPRRRESLTIRCHYKGSGFLLIYLKTLSVGPAGVLNS